MTALGALAEYVRTRGGQRGRRHMHLDPFDSKECPVGLDFMASTAGHVLRDAFVKLQVISTPGSGSLLHHVVVYIYIHIYVGYDICRVCDCAHDALNVTGVASEEQACS